MTTVAQDVPLSRADYERLVDRVRDRVKATVPPGGVVAVVSRGDPALIELDGRDGWHFPQDDSGVYAGHHPADSTDAIANLEALRARGAGFLLVPATSFWWFRHYGDFKRHLDRRHALVAHDQDACIYSLDAQAAGGSAGADLSPLRRKSLLGQIEDVVESTLPETAHVLVWLDAPTEPVQLDGRRIESFPQGPDGDPVFSVPESKDAISQLDSLRAGGARYLVVSATAFGLLDQCPALRRHLEAKHAVVIDQRHLCRIYELREAASPPRRRLFRRLGHG